MKTDINKIISIINNWNYNEKITIKRISDITGISIGKIFYADVKDLIKSKNLELGLFRTISTNKMNLKHQNIDELLSKLNDNYPNAIWKQLEKYPNYIIGNNGLVFSTYRNIILKPSFDTNGYSQVNIAKVGSKLLHRLVAETFIPNPENKPEINHINYDKNDNRVENLEWCTRNENMQHSWIRINNLRATQFNTQPKSGLKWKKYMCVEIALEYKTRNEFATKNVNAYSAAKRYGWLDDICQHMVGNINWTKELVNKAAKEHITKVEFKNKNPNAYQAAYRNNWLDDACQHMVNGNFKKIRKIKTAA